MCLNRMCVNFGAYFGTEPGSNGTTDSRYEIFDVVREGVPAKKLRCRYCRAESRLHSAHSLRPVGRHFLSESLPFADCGEEDCENHGRNVYSSLPPRKGRGRGDTPYHRNGEHYLTCRRRRLSGKQCEESITLGVRKPRGASKEDERKKSELALHLIRLGLSATRPPRMVGGRVVPRRLRTACPAARPTLCEIGKLILQGTVVWLGHGPRPVTLPPPRAGRRRAPRARGHGAGPARPRPGPAGPSGARPSRG